MQIRSNICPKSIGDGCCTAFTFGIIPVVYYLEVWIVIPKIYQPWYPTYLFHFCLSHFLLFNLVSNLIATMLIDTSIHGKILLSERGRSWRFCSICETAAPPRSWHCPICNTCILKRDHHCMFTSCCIGHFNHRFYLLSLFYIFVATTYCTIFNLMFLYDFVTTFNPLILTSKLLCPLEWAKTELYVTFIIMVVAFTSLYSGVLLCIHLNLILKGMVIHERRNKLSVYDKGYIENLKMAMGNRWFLVWVSPFLKSELPSDGFVWNTEHIRR